MEKTFDYIIAGGGSAGCTLASRLCENKDVNVLLIEAGGSVKAYLLKCQEVMDIYLVIQNLTGVLNQYLNPDLTIEKFYIQEVRG